MTEPVLAVGPDRRARRAPRRGQVHSGGDLVDRWRRTSGVGNVHPPAREHPVGEGVLDREQRDGVPGQPLHWGRVSDAVAGVDQTALVGMEGV